MLGRSSNFAAAVVLAVCGGVQGAHAQGAFTLSSTGFKDGERLPTKFAGNNKSNPNCPGDNVSPALSWANPPEGAKSYALVVFDIDAPRATGFVHWVAYGIPTSVTGFAEGEVSKQTDKYVGGKSSVNLSHFFGPCPPPGPSHHYIFTLYATDLEPTALKEGMTRDELLKSLDGHVKSITSLVGIFSKQ